MIQNCTLTSDNFHLKMSTFSNKCHLSSKYTFLTLPHYVAANRENGIEIGWDSGKIRFSKSYHLCKHVNPYLTWYYFCDAVFTYWWNSGRFRNRCPWYHGMCSTNWCKNHLHQTFTFGDIGLAILLDNPHLTVKDGKFASLKVKCNPLLTRHETFVCVFSTTTRLYMTKIEVSSTIEHALQTDIRSIKIYSLLVEI